MIYAFAGFDLDTRSFELRRRSTGEVVTVEPQVFDVLRFLVEHADRVVAKEELQDAVWGTRFVTESAVTSRIKSARRAVGDDGRSQRVIRTVHGRGYRLVAEVSARDEPGPSSDRAASACDGSSAASPAAPSAGWSPPPCRWRRSPASPGRAARPRPTCTPSPAATPSS